MMGKKERQFAPLCNRSVEELVPADYFYRHLDAKLDLSFVRDLVRDKYAPQGRPSIDPIVFFKLQLVMFFEGLRSERELVRVAADRLSVRWYLGYDLDEDLPDQLALDQAGPPAVAQQQPPKGLARALRRLPACHGRPHALGGSLAVWARLHLWVSLATSAPPRFGDSVTPPAGSCSGGQWLAARRPRCG